MNVTQEQQQVTGMPQEQQPFPDLVSSSGVADQYAGRVMPLQYGSQLGAVDNTAMGIQQELSTTMPSWSAPSETVTQPLTSLTQTSNHPPQFNTAGITGNSANDNNSGGLPTIEPEHSRGMSSAVQGLQHTGNEVPTMYNTEGFNAQYSATSNQQTTTSMLPNTNQPPLYSNFVNHVPSNSSVTQPTTSSSQPIASAVATTAVTTLPSSQSQSEQPGQKKELPYNEDTGIVILCSRIHYLLKCGCLCISMVPYKI